MRGCLSPKMNFWRAWIRRISGTELRRARDVEAWTSGRPRIRQFRPANNTVASHCSRKPPILFLDLAASGTDWLNHTSKFFPQASYSRESHIFFLACTAWRGVMTYHPGKLGWAVTRKAAFRKSFEGKGCDQLVSLRSTCSFLYMSSIVARVHFLEY